jgi:hypothetical protein
MHISKPSGKGAGRLNSLLNTDGNADIKSIEAGKHTPGK